MTADNEDSLLSSVAQQAGSIRAVCLRAEQQAEATLREQASLLNLTHDAIFVRDMNGTIKYWNRGAEELYGWPAEQAVGRVGHVLLKTIFLVPPEQIQEEVIVAGRWEGELVQTRKDGSQVVVSSRLSLQSDERNEPVGIIVINNDITKRKRAEEVARRSEKELRDVVNAVPGFVWSALPDGAVDFVNERWLEFTGLSPQDALGWNWQAAVHPDDRSRTVAEWRETLKNGRSTEGELRVRRADGEFRWWFFRYAPLYDEAGNITKWYGTGIDIEDRKRAESLFAGEKRILEMVATGGSLAEILESLCRLVEEQAGDVLASILLVDGDHLRHGGALSLPKAYTDAINGIVIGPSAGSCGTAAYRGQPVIVEDIATDPLWADYRELALPHSLCACWSTPVFSSQGKVIATVAMYYREPRRPTQRNQEIIDRITHFAGAAIQQKLAQENLQRSEAYLAQAEKLTHTGGWAWDPRTDKVLYCSEEMYRIFGLDPRKSLPTRENFRQQIHPEDRDWVRKRLERSLRERVDAFAEYRVLLPDGTVRHINASGHPVLDEDGELIELIGTATDITERKRAEEALRGSEAKFRDYAESASDWYWETDPDHKFTRLTEDERRLARGFATVSRIGVARWEFATDIQSEPEKWKLHRSMLEARQPFRDFVYRATHSDGSVVYNKISGKPVFDANGEFRGYRGTGTDVTALRTAEGEARENEQRYRKAELELAHANRVATMGQLTASITHEVNQPITAAVTYASAARRLLSAEPPDLHEVDDVLALIVKEGTRAGEVVGRIRALIKKAPARKDAVEINDAILEVIALTRTEAANNSVSVRTQLAEGWPRVRGDRVQLQQVLLNLIINAIEAMRDVGEEERELLISSRNEPDGVSVEGRDSGPGFAPAAVGRGVGAVYTRHPGGV